MTTSPSSRLPVLVAYDGSEGADQALAWAAEEAAATRLPLRVLTVEQVPTSPWGGDVQGRDSEMAERAGKVLADAGFRDASVERHSGHVVGELLRQADAASMLVVGSQGHGRVGEVVTGSVSQHLARHATCTVVVVRQPRTPGHQRIVVGVDGSPPSHAALEAACRRAERTGEELLAVHGWRVRVPSTDVWNAEPRSIEGIPERERLLAEAVAGVATDHPDVVLQQEVVPVSPEQVLVDASSRASLVVVGSRGLGFFSGLLLGSVSQDVLARAHCPVMVVR